MQEFLKTKRDPKRRCGIYFSFTHLCGLFVPKPLVGFLFQFYFLIGKRFVFPSYSFGFVSFLYRRKEGTFYGGLHCLTF